MRRWALPLLALTLAFLHAPLTAQEPAAASAGETAVRAVVQKYVDAREAKDPKAIEALFTDDADQLVSDGTWRKGRDALVPRHARIVEEEPGQAEHHRRVGAVPHGRRRARRRPLHAEGPGGRQGPRDVDGDHPEARAGRLADRRDPEHAAFRSAARMSETAGSAWGRTLIAMSPTIRLLGPEDASLLDRVAPDVFDNPIDRAGPPSSSPTGGITWRSRSTATWLSGWHRRSTISIPTSRPNSGSTRSG